MSTPEKNFVKIFPFADAGGRFQIPIRKLTPFKVETLFAEHFERLETGLRHKAQERNRRLLTTIRGAQDVDIFRSFLHSPSVRKNEISRAEREPLIEGT